MSAKDGDGLAVTLTVDELRALVREAVRDEVSRTTEESEILTRDDAAALLQVHPVMVTRYVRKEGLPAIPLGREWRFRRSEILAWLDARGVNGGRR